MRRSNVLPPTGKSSLCSTKEHEMNAVLSSHVANARNYYVARPQQQILAAKAIVARAATTSDPPAGLGNVPTMFQPNGNTTGGVMQFNGTLPDSVSAAQRTAFASLLKNQQFYLQSGLGLVTAYMTRKYEQDPVQWANPVNWQAPLSNLPPEFYTLTDITQYTFQQQVAGVQIATSFLTSLVSWASGVGLVGAFTSFLNQLGGQISAGVKATNSSMQTYHLAFGYQPMLDPSGTWQLVSTADYYFISFSESEKTVYSSCASAELFNFNFNYRKGSILLNWAAMSDDANSDNLSEWNDVITGSTHDDLTRAKNFFGGNAAPASKS
jgi:Virulence factor Evf